MWMENCFLCPRNKANIGSKMGLDELAIGRGAATLALENDEHNDGDAG